MEQENQKKKNYKNIFWNLFGVGIIVNLVINSRAALNLPKIVAPFLLIALLVIVGLWMKYFNDAWKAIGKKHGWALGLIVLIPFGPFIAIAIAAKYLKETEYWASKEYESFKLQ